MAICLVTLSNVAVVIAKILVDIGKIQPAFFEAIVHGTGSLEDRKRIN